MQITAETFPQDELAGTVETLGDVIEPVLPPEEWEAEAGDAGPVPTAEQPQ